MRCSCPITDLDVYAFPFEPIDSRMYIVLDGSSSALIVDPCVSESAQELLEARGIRSAAVFLTHEHYDHISGVNALRTMLNGQVIACKACGDALPNPKRNLSSYFESLFCMRSEAVRQFVRDMKVGEYSCRADIVFDNEYSCPFGWHTVRAEVAPGHSRGSVLISIDGKCLFTGDSLLHVPVVTRLPGGNMNDYKETTVPMLLSYPPDTMVYPGHGNAGTMIEMCLEV